MPIEEEKKQKSETGEEVVDHTDYITAIKELKEKSVDRSQYDAVKAENKRLLDALVNGQEVDGKEKKPQFRDPEDIRKDLFLKDNTNLEYVKYALELRNSLISKGERDPFLPYGEKVTPQPSDVEAAEKVAQVYQECIDYADGDSDLFTQELMRRTNLSIYDKLNQSKRK